MERNDYLEEGTKVKFDYQTVKGEGVIKGISTIALPIIGKSYIVEITNSKGFSKDAYPYSCITVYEEFLTIIN